MTDLASLLARVKAATGSDDSSIRGLDFADAVAREIFGFRFTLEDAGQVHDALRSLDAALALCERALPGWGFSVTRKGDWSWACVNEPEATVEIVRGEATTPALALLAALITAMEQKQ